MDAEFIPPLKLCIAAVPGGGALAFHSYDEGLWWQFIHEEAMRQLEQKDEFFLSNWMILPA